MLRSFLLLSLFVLCVKVEAQKKKVQDSLARQTDSLAIADSKEASIESIATVSIDEADVNGGGGQSGVSPLLLNSRDPFFSAATFNFSTGRYRFRGYSNDFGSTYMNGLTMESLESGFTPFGQWGGLNYVLRNRQISIGLAPTNFGYGNIGTAVNIDTRASKQRKQTQVGYTFSNGNYSHRVSFSHSTGMSKKGWALTLSGTFRGADEGYAPGTYANNYSYFVGIDKKIGEKHLLSVVGFGAPTENGRAGSSVKEMQDIANDHFYNPNWGYQNGKKRNAVVTKSNQPVIILTDDYKVSKNSSVVTAVGYTFGDRSTSTLDWYNSDDPRPDYYRYLPSYYEDDPNAQANIRQALMSDESKRQINWDKLYTSNRSNYETFRNVNGNPNDSVVGLRSRYLAASNVTNTKRGSIRTVFNQRVNKNLDFSFGISYQAEKNNYYKRIEDLLGGNYFVDLNQFAERDFPANPNAGQPDLNHLNRVVTVGDRYNYDYDITINKTAMWSQGQLHFSKLDLFAAAEISNTQFWRTGHMKNGLFPNNSYGKSAEYTFNNYSVKGGLSYKISSRHFIYINAVQMTRAPFYRNVYLSPRTRDLVQDNIRNERIMSAEGGYVVTTPVIKVRLTGYYTESKNRMSVLSFYDDTYRSFVNYALNKQNRTDFGGELGLESRVIKNITISGAASVGRHYYTGRPEVTVTQDNNSTVLAKTTIYSENYRYSTPQEAYTLGLQYRSPKYWYVGGNVNYFDQMWVDFNPIRRTTGIVQNIEYDSKLWHDILDQQRLPGQTVVNAFAGYSWKLPASFGFKRRTFLSLNVNVNNILDNKDFVTSGREQLRYDNVDNNVDKFPPRYFYAYGRTYYLTATLRF